MTPVTQSRVGENGTCLRACIASVLDLRERQVPDFGDNWLSELNAFLATHGLQYRRVFADAARPAGWSTVEGVSPRGGLHACVAYDGRLVHDPHPQDGTGRGLVEVRYYGLLEPVAAAQSMDAVKPAILTWRVAAPSTGRYRSFYPRGWPSASYSDGRAAVSLYADVPYEQRYLETAEIKVNVADWSQPGNGFKWRTLMQRAKGVKEAKALAERFLAAHPAYSSKVQTTDGEDPPSNYRWYVTKSKSNHYSAALRHTINGALLARSDLKHGSPQAAKQEVLRYLSSKAQATGNAPKR